MEEIQNDGRDIERWKKYKEMEEIKRDKRDIDRWKR